MPQKILFVCLGNICRSPLAEGIFLHLCAEQSLSSVYSVDSAGTGDWHAGQQPDKRSIAAAQRQGIKLTHVCRQIRLDDFLKFDQILVMDKSNLQDLTAQCPPQYRTKIKLIRDFDSDGEKGLDVPDPYYGGPSDFDAVYSMLYRCCTCLLNDLENLR